MASQENPNFISSNTSDLKDMANNIRSSIQTDFSAKVGKNLSYGVSVPDNVVLL
jgi:hypothetical protein